MDLNKILSGLSFSPCKVPKKIIFMLHGYGDSANNFINIANLLNQPEYCANFIALDAPSFIPNYPKGRQWFNLYPNGIYISEAGNNEIKIIRKEIFEALQLLENTIKKIKKEYNLKFKDCFLIGFSQGGMMTFEFGNYFNKILGGLAILSGRVIFEEPIKNSSLGQTPIFISHGNKDEVLPISLFKSSCLFLENNKLNFESHILEDDGHTISNEAIKLLQKFIKKNL